MPTDATGTPTSLGIRKYNPAADAPSGLGFNGAMDDVDALLVARIAKPTSPTTGDALVWNGTSWDKSSGATKIAIAGLAGYPADASKALMGDGTWVAPAGALMYRKTTQKLISNTTTETDILNGEITVAAGAMGTTKLLRATLQGEVRNGVGSDFTLRVKFGGVTVFANLLRTAGGGAHAGGATRTWRAQFEVIPKNSQTANQMHGSIETTSNAATTGLYTNPGGTLWTSMNQFAASDMTIDFSTSKLVEVTFQWGTAAATNEIELNHALFEVI